MTKTTIEREWQLSAHETDNDYLHHEAFSPVDKEITAVDLDSVGDIPPDIDGVYVRNGHNPIYQPRSGRYHWFDGDGMIHATTFSNAVNTSDATDARFANHAVNATIGSNAANPIEPIAFASVMAAVSAAMPTSHQTQQQHNHIGYMCWCYLSGVCVKS